MQVIPIEILASGPGVDLTNLPTGLSVRMADPVADLAYARNAVTLVYDLAVCRQVRLSFAALEYGDEPHEPPANPFGDDACFDGVAISTDGVAWYEVQDLRHLRSDRFTHYDLDLDAAVAALGLSYGSGFRVRFSQYDNNPAPMDGIFLRGIELTAELRAPVFHLPMDDNASAPTIRDAAAGGQDQVLLDPGGDPNTAAHSVPGPRATTGLSFDGVDDRIDFGPALLGELVTANRDFTLAFWFRAADPGAASKTFFCRRGSDAQPHWRFFLNAGRLYWRVAWEGGYVSLGSAAGVLDAQWHHVAGRRQGQTLALWLDGADHDTRTHPDYTGNLFGDAWDARAIGQVYGTSASDWPIALADLRAYDRALSDEEITTLSAPTG